MIKRDKIAFPQILTVFETYELHFIRWRIKQKTSDKKAHYTKNGGFY